METKIKIQGREQITKVYKEISQTKGFFGLHDLVYKRMIERYGINYSGVKKYFGSHKNAIKICLE